MTYDDRHEWRECHDCGEVLDATDACECDLRREARHDEPPVGDVLLHCHECDRLCAPHWWCWRPHCADCYARIGDDADSAREVAA